MRKKQHDLEPNLWSQLYYSKWTLCTSDPDLTAYSIYINIHILNPVILFLFFFLKKLLNFAILCQFFHYINFSHVFLNMVFLLHCSSFLLRFLSITHQWSYILHNSSPLKDFCVCTLFLHTHLNFPNFLALELSLIYFYKLVLSTHVLIISMASMPM